MNQTIHRVFFLMPDLKEPSGGIKRLYRYANHLRAEGYRVFAVHGDPGFGSYPFAPSSVPVIYGNQLPSFDERDVMLVPEVFGKVLPQLAKLPCQRVMVPLNWNSIFTELPENTTWDSWGIRDVLTTCATIADFVRLTMVVRVTVVRPMVDPALYHHDPRAKRNQISYLVRKDVDGGKIIRIAFARPERFGLAGWAVRPIEGLDEPDYAKVLRESRIFLATYLYEGAPTPTLEAMACGCKVVGYRNPSLHEHCAGMPPDAGDALFNGGDYLSVLRWLAQPRPAHDAERQSRMMRAKYPPENERRDLLDFFDTLKFGHA